MVSWISYRIISIFIAKDAKTVILITSYLSTCFILTNIPKISVVILVVSTIKVVMKSVKFLSQVNVNKVWCVSIEIPNRNVS